MKLIAPFAAIIAAVSAGNIYAHQPAENYAHSAEIYQSQLEYQQQGLYSDQSHAFADHGSANQGRHSDKTAKILSHISERDGHGYQYSYETDNGIKAQESGHVHEGTSAQGAYSYTGDDGHVYTVTYTADEHGFRAQGHHLPTPPPVPEEIAKALEQNAKDESQGVFDDGKYVEQHEEASHGSSQEYHPQEFQHSGQGFQHQQFQQYEQGYGGHLSPSAEPSYHKH